MSRGPHRTGAFWSQCVNTAIGLWMIVAPEALGFNEPAWTNDEIIGPFVAALSTVAIWEATRAVRWWVFPFGLWMIAAPWVLGYEETLPKIHSVAVGVVVAAMATVPARRKNDYGGGWLALIRGGQPPSTQRG